MWNLGIELGSSTVEVGVQSYLQYGVANRRSTHSARLDAESFGPYPVWLTVVRPNRGGRRRRWHEEEEADDVSYGYDDK